MKEIENRGDVEFLVTEFYARIRKDISLGPIFEAHIPEDKWSAHLGKMTDFWETNLLQKRTFKGDPIFSHVAVDETVKNSITQEHFASWVRLWFGTLNDYFEGEKVEKAKAVARILTTQIYLAIWNNRQNLNNGKNA